MPSGYEGGRREKLADFVGPTPMNSSKIRRPDALAFDYLTAFCPGPVANGDTSQGVVSHAWRCRVENPSVFDLTGRVYISRQNDAGDNWGPEVELFTFTGDDIEEVDIAFEQAGRPVVCAERNGHVWLYWFNTLTAAFEFTNFAVGRTPRVILDAPFDITSSDVLLFYLTVDSVVYRQQQDRYGNELVVPFIVDENYYIEDVVKLRDSRIRVDVSHRNVATGKYTYEHVTSTLYPILVNDSNLSVDFSLSSIDLVIAVIEITLPEDSVNLGFSFISGLLAQPLIDKTLSDADGTDLAFTFRSALLADTIIQAVLYDKSEVDLAFTFRSATMPVIVIDHTLFDKDGADLSFSFQSATLVTV